jgi:hypothetical protein
MYFVSRIHPDAAIRRIIHQCDWIVLLTARRIFVGRGNEAPSSVNIAENLGITNTIRTIMERMPVAKRTAG